MTKTKKTIMWSVLACLLVAGVAGGAIGVTYARYSSTATGTGAAAVAYWDVSVTPADSAQVSLKASPAATAYSGEGSYSEDYARTNTSDPVLAATLTNSGDVSATVTVEQTGTLGYTLRDNENSESIKAEGSAYLAAIDDHFDVLLFQTDTDYSSTTETPSLSDLGGEITLAKNGSLYIYCELVWTSDISDCYGDSADAFDTWIGTNVASIDFTLSYSAVQAADPD